MSEEAKLLIILIVSFVFIGVVAICASVFSQKYKLDSIDNIADKVLDCNCTVNKKEAK